MRRVTHGRTALVTARGRAATLEPRTAGHRGTPRATKLALLATLIVTAASLTVFATAVRGESIDPRSAAAFLWLYTVLFVLRVAGQVLVRTRAPDWLPPTSQWNVMPYHLLLPAQVAIVAVMISVDFELTLDGAAAGRPLLGEGIVWLSGLYASAMPVRYAIRMARKPDQRWFGGTIPIVFHLVLASYLFVFGSFHASY